MKVSEYIQITYEWWIDSNLYLAFINSSVKPIFTRDRVYCQDGFSISIQSSSYSYSTPRDNQSTYTHLELGFPSQEEKYLLEWSDGDIDPYIYPYVPIEIVEEVIQKHGGIDVYKTLQPYPSLLRDEKLKDLGFKF